jgi:hypothetical protein
MGLTKSGRYLVYVAVVGRSENTWEGSRDHENTREVLWRRVGRVIESNLKRGAKALTLPPERPYECIWTQRHL